jgi:anti-sigma B factor antagonist
MNTQCCHCYIAGRTGTNQAGKASPRATCRTLHAASAAVYRLESRHRTTVTHFAKCKIKEVATATTAQYGQQQLALLAMRHRVVPTGEVTADIDGELDIATAEMAVSYVTTIIDHHRGFVTINLKGLRFCDASGLSALLRIADYAKQTDCPLMLASPSPSLIKLMRITGLDRKLLPRA